MMNYHARTFWFKSSITDLTCILVSNFYVLFYFAPFCRKIKIVLPVIMKILSQRMILQEFLVTLSAAKFFDLFTQIEKFFFAGQAVSDGSWKSWRAICCRLSCFKKAVAFLGAKFIFLFSGLEFFSAISANFWLKICSFLRNYYMATFYSTGKSSSKIIWPFIWPASKRFLANGTITDFSWWGWNNFSHNSYINKFC